MNSVISDSNDLSVERVSTQFANTRHHPKYFRERASTVSFYDIDHIPIVRKLGGILCLIVVIICCLLMLENNQNIASLWRDAPFFPSYSMASGLTIVFPIWCIAQCVNAYRHRSSHQFTENAFRNESTFTKREILYRHTTDPLWRRLFVPSIGLALLYVFCVYLWLISLDKTVVPHRAAIFQLNTIIIYILSILVLHNLHYRGSWQKSIAMLCIITSGALTLIFSSWTTSDNVPSHHEEVLGIVQCTASVVVYSMYLLPLKWNANRFVRKCHDILLLLGSIGLAALLLLWPIVLCLDFFGVESIEWPNTDWLLFVMEGIGLSAALGMCVYLTNTVVASTGFLLTLPIIFISDVLTHQRQIKWPSVITTADIVIAFILVDHHEMETILMGNSLCHNILEYIVLQHTQRIKISSFTNKIIQNVDLELVFIRYKQPSHGI